MIRKYIIDGVELQPEEPATAFIYIALNKFDWNFFHCFDEVRLSAVNEHLKNYIITAIDAECVTLEILHDGVQQ